ncbi:probable receptor-like protein kinase At2g47060 isoform X2 [Zingiber officinale]|uniref:probable receptor-like protein kinase At2g47060 isoform X2 n=1 Tax=Zingiber officinale TaxID=94328 RepID=UPI001C4BE4C0|nr:probable receptor-like protein kinase At2g47060 isoform X2 [Zingiber officinale]XP_042430311.1 probable receptor-like protein kinase At2g47060 isoform X2 [Zingiber officinale]
MCLIIKNIGTRRRTPHKLTTKGKGDSDVDHPSLLLSDDRIQAKPIRLLPIEVPAIPTDDIKVIMQKLGNVTSDGSSLYTRVYCDTLRNGQKSAIKMLDDSGKTDQEFLTQVAMTESLQHENIVKLLGYGYFGNTRFLAYEFADMGSLHDILHGKKGVEGASPGPLLSWSQRVKIALRAAKGLEYLHEKAKSPAIHCAVKSSNILLFSGDVVKLGEFNLSIKAPGTGLSLWSAQPLGNFVYQAPEFVSIGQLTSKSDVYSFGVVLLELLTGRKPLDRSRPHQEQSLVAADKLAYDKVGEIVDNRLRGKYPPKSVAWMATIASACLQFDQDHRPEMSHVVKALRRNESLMCS